MNRHGIISAVVSALALGYGAMPVSAASVTVNNFSFETPSAAANPYWSGIPTDNGTSTGQWLGYGAFYAVVQSGGPNAYNVSPTGIDGMQFGDQSAQAGTGIFQDLADYSGGGSPDQYWQAGMTYTLTLGLFSRGDNPVPANDALDLSLYYRTSRSGGANVLETTTVLGNQVLTGSLTDFTVTTTIELGNAAVGQPIGVWVASTVGPAGGDWGVDNVRLTVTPVPEPSMFALGGLGLAALLVLRRRR